MALTNHLDTERKRDNFAAAALRHYAEGLRQTTRKRSYQGEANASVRERLLDAARQADELAESLSQHALTITAAP